MANIFNDRLGFNFDVQKFGEALDPYDTSEREIFNEEPLITKWMYDALANNDVVGFFKNPLSNTILSIRVTANNIAATCNTYGVLSTIEAAAANLSIQCIPFKSHTDNISGVTTSSSLTAPDFGTGIGIGKSIKNFVSVYENIYDQRTVLGSFTSLFIGPELRANDTLLIQDHTSINNSIYIVSDDGMGNVTYASNLSLDQQTTILSRIVSLDSYIETREAHDVNYYTESFNLLQDANKLLIFNGGLPPLETNLVIDYVGTDKLKSKL